MFGAYTTHCALPGCLGAVHGHVGGPKSSSATVPSAMPTLAVTKTSRPSTSKGACRAATSRSAVSTALATPASFLDEDGELVASEPCHRVARRQCIPQTGADATQESVTRDMTKAVVHGLEVVEVEEQHRHSARALLADVERMLDAVREQRPVREPGERVVERLMAQLLLGFPASRDIEQVALENRLALVRDDPRLVLHPHDAAVARAQPVLDEQWFSGGMRALMRGEDALAILRVEELDEEVAVLDPLVDRVSEQRFDLRARVDVRAHLVQAVDVDGERQALDQHPVTELGAPKPCLRIAPLADVPNAGGEERRAGQIDAPDRELRREDRAVRTHGVDFDALAEETSRTGTRSVLGPACERSTVCSPGLRRDDELGQLAPEDLVPAVPEGLLRGLVELEDEPPVIDDDDAVECRVEDRVRVRRTEVERCGRICRA